MIGSFIHAVCTVRRDNLHIGNGFLFLLNALRQLRSVVRVAVHQLKSYRLHVTFLDVEDELRMREIVHEALAVVDGRFRIKSKHTISSLPLIVRFATDPRALARVAHVARLREILEQLLLCSNRSRCGRRLFLHVE